MKYYFQYEKQAALLVAYFYVEFKPRKMKNRFKKQKQKQKNEQKQKSNEKIPK